VAKAKKKAKSAKTAKAKPKPKAKPRASAVIAAAKKIAEPAERATFLVAALDRVDKPAKLVEPLFLTFDEFMQPDEVGVKVLALAEGRDAEFLDGAGSMLEAHRQRLEEYAIPVWRMALAAGSKNEHTLATLGRLLVLRGDATGVPFLERAIESSPVWEAPRLSLAVWLHDKDPGRALDVIAECTGSYAHELRAMIHAAVGRTQEAERAQRRALETYADDTVGHMLLSDWHYEENRYDRALVHARHLFERRRHEDCALDGVDESIARAFRLGGAFKDIVPWLVERCANAELPANFAWHVFHGLTAFHPPLESALAIRAAEAAMAIEVVPSEILLWRVRIAGVRASLGDISALEALARDGLDDNAPAWIELADRYLAVDLDDAASAALDRGLQLDPNSADALITMFDLALSAGDADTLHRAAEALVVAKPHWYNGTAHVARSYARRGDGEPAVTHAKRAAQLAPYSELTWIALAEACLVAGDLDGARDATQRSLEIVAAEKGDDISIVHAALFGDAVALDRALADRYGRLPALPFPKFVEALREANRRCYPA
jgi:tetratricopeptide (TPR) repeat protein